MGTAFQLVTHFSDNACAGVPIYMYTSPTSDCQSASACASRAFTDVNSTVYNATSCVSDRYAGIADAFGSSPFLGYDKFSDDACSEYLYTLAYLADGNCYVWSSNQSVIAEMYASGEVALEYYKESEDCTSGRVAFSASPSSIANATCLPSGGGNSRVFFTLASLQSSKTGSSASSSSAGSTTGPSPFLSTGAIIGIAAGCVVAILLALALLMRLRRRKREINASAHEESLLGGNGSLQGKTDTSEATLQHSMGPSKSQNADGVAGNLLWTDETLVSWRIPRDKVELGPLISRGGYGEVYRGTYNTATVAVKMLLPDTRRSIKHVNAFLAEAKMMVALEHTRIVQFIGVAWDSLHDLCVLSEYVAGGDLRTLLIHYEATHHPLGFDCDKVRIALHVAHALAYLHSLPQPVIHRDLKSRNVLLTPELDAKLTDFGVSRDREDCTMTAGVGTSLWMAPEIMMGERYGTAADMFSFGVLLNELDVHSLPYSYAKEDSGRQVPDAAILHLVAMGSLRVEFSPGLWPDVVELGVACVSTDPKQRPTAPEALYRLQTVLNQL